MTWHRHDSQHGLIWSTRHPNEPLQVGDYVMFRIGATWCLRMVTERGIADCGMFASRSDAQGWAERQPQYIAS